MNSICFNFYVSTGGAMICISMPKAKLDLRKVKLAIHIVIKMTTNHNH